MENAPDAVEIVRWMRKPGDKPIIKFVTFSILAVILWLILMIFMPALRNAVPASIFIAVFAAILTIPTVVAQRNLVRGLAKRINDTLTELTGSPDDKISTKQLRKLIKSGEQLPLLINGVPGLRLHVKRVASAKEDGSERLLAIITVAPVSSGTASFDRLLEAALYG
ncbi:hypothetical protein StoSoilA2_42590 [Arthrobacter sp. StoSoilA2]|uniref:hypothetical protein n=1 Tax=unclassified Arthrobacter TaxID=235627 RepID=UPI001CC4FD31|nr:MULTISPECIES: hypothetical protein [unclassified Arthrobacter]BCW38203.1 hypothetical protein StoSoilA2_42590 [Arthrobacter sp. StoSoilA2]BCW50564.1 hypothetical protein StoSoilB13_29060 [Arthrobacter sp. StoSoilB13]